jgi:replicative DNA helicase
MEYDPNRTGSVDRLPPQNLEAEVGTIGAIMVDNNQLDAVVKILPTAEPFYRDSHQVIWASVLDMYRDNKPIDWVTLRDELERVGQFHAIGGMDGLTAIIEGVPSVRNGAYYAGIVREHSDRRRFIDIASRMLSDAYSYRNTAGEMITESMGRIFDLAEGQSRGRMRSVHEIMPERLAALSLRADTGEVTGLGSGWSDLDDLTGGFQPEQLIIIAGRPSMGKSAMGLNIADHLAFDMKCRVFYASLEMGQDSLVDRIIGSRGRIDSAKIRTGQGIGYKEIAALGMVRQQTNLPLLWIDDSPSQSMLSIMAAARSLSRKGGLGAIVVDYIQLVEPEDPRVSRQEQVAKISMRLKQLARELKVPVIALAQINRKAEERDGNRPRMSDLKESGGIEQDADMVLLLYRSDYYEKDREYAPVVESEVIVAKNRSGPTGTVKLGLNLPCMRFDQLNNHAQKYDDVGDEI